MQGNQGRTRSGQAANLTTAIRSLLGAIMQAFCVLNSIEYAAPWRETVLKRPIK